MKLADFGVYKLLKLDFAHSSNVNYNNTSYSTGGWTAPELNDEHTNRYDYKVDIFLLGCIYGYTLSGGKHPFGDKNYQHPSITWASLLVQDDLKEPYSSDESAFDLIQTMVELNPEKRPSVDEVLRDGFFKMPNEKNNDSDNKRVRKIRIIQYKKKPYYHINNYLILIDDRKRGPQDLHILNTLVKEEKKWIRHKRLLPHKCSTL